jgi:hypothetical protein
MLLDWEIFRLWLISYNVVEESSNKFKKDAYSNPINILMTLLVHSMEETMLLRRSDVLEP